MSARLSRLVCAGCGAVAGPWRAVPVPLPERGRGDDVDHVLRRELDLSTVRFPDGDAEPNPFVRYRHAAPRLPRRAGRRPLRRGVLRARAASSTTRSPRSTGTASPSRRSRAAPSSATRSGFSEPGGVWVKDETGNVSGSHKARHLFGVLL